MKFQARKVMHRYHKPKRHKDLKDSQITVLLRIDIFHNRFYRPGMENYFWHGIFVEYTNDVMKIKRNPENDGLCRTMRYTLKK